MANIKTKKNHPEKPIVLSLGALGIVYGDIGTSPLYAFKESFLGGSGLQPSNDHILGVLSLIVWSLIIVISLKYLFVVMRADNEGEGGIVALVSLFENNSGKKTKLNAFFITIGLFGAALLYGDGTITPAISVLSALEGLDIATTQFQNYIVPITVVILIGLFALQSHGTARIGRFFGPVMLLWFIILGLLGLNGIVHAPEVLFAVNPVWAISFVTENPAVAFIVLGAVFLAVTGGETLYADMGHFGVKPIRIAWFGLVLPCLLLNYFGQGALVLSDTTQIQHPFYHLAPNWALYPLVALSTVATIIASQAVISGVFSLTRQAINMGRLPKLRIIQTSSHSYGQIYIPLINWVLMVTTIALVVSMRSSSNLASAYGVAISTDMVITTLLIIALALRWKWHYLVVALMVFVFLPVDLAFLTSSLIKIPSGGWYPLVAGSLVFFLMLTWRKGEIQQRRLLRWKRPLFQKIPDLLSREGLERPDGTCVFLVNTDDGHTPAALYHLVDRLHAVQKTIVLINVTRQNVPVVPKKRKIKVSEVAESVYLLSIQSGFTEDINIPKTLKRCKKKIPGLEMSNISYVLTNTIILADKEKGHMCHWRETIYSFMKRNSIREPSFFKIPPGKIIEIGIQIDV